MSFAVSPGQEMKAFRLMSSMSVVFVGENKVR